MTLCSQTALNGYAIMWLYVMFDLPTETKRQRHDAAKFRKDLLEDGFSPVTSSYCFCVTSKTPTKNGRVSVTCT